MFTGEIHNPGLGGYQANTVTSEDAPEWIVKDVEEIRRLAREHAHLVAASKPNPRKLAYASAMRAGLAIPVFGYAFTLRWAFSTWL